MPTPVLILFLSMLKYNNLLTYKQLLFQWPLQDPKLEVPTMYKAYFSGICKGIPQQNMAKHMVRLRTSMCWILKFPLIIMIRMIRPVGDESPQKEYHRFNGITTWDHDQIRCKSTNLSKVSPYLFAGTEVQSGAP